MLVFSAASALFFKLAFCSTSPTTTTSSTRYSYSSLHCPRPLFVSSWELWFCMICLVQVLYTSTSIQASTLIVNASLKYNESSPYNKTFFMSHQNLLRVTAKPASCEEASKKSASCKATWSLPSHRILLMCGWLARKDSVLNTTQMTLLTPFS